MKVIAESNGHHWVEAFNLVCCRDCGIVRRFDDNNKPCPGVVKIRVPAYADPNFKYDERTQSYHRIHGDVGSGEVT